MSKELDLEKIRQIAWMAWKGAANAHRLYPDNKHTFEGYWSSNQDQFNEFLPLCREIEQDGWIDVNERLPDIGEEYNVVWDLDDGQEPVSTTMEFIAITKKWIDMQTGKDFTDSIIYWRELPKPPMK